MRGVERQHSNQNFTNRILNVDRLHCQMHLGGELMTAERQILLQPLNAYCSTAIPLSEFGLSVHRFVTDKHEEIMKIGRKHLPCSGALEIGRTALSQILRYLSDRRRDSAARN